MTVQLRLDEGPWQGALVMAEVCVPFWDTNFSPGADDQFLKQDETIYSSWLFIGLTPAGLEQPDQAKTRYKKAIDLELNQLLSVMDPLFLSLKSVNMELNIYGS
ncbi:hypothetical protein DUI87_00599 [Hirundo rustica rustica]|uniref:Uncharacterized protein n=1 Tax=Hirundo rustica rustica TaxID=333673 RepID=A0A3M0LTF1_HIRRU|nr:hypothetical protein DUI87_00599 [Hirundo rustica rustica]